MNVLAVCAGGAGLELGIKIAVPDARTVAYLEREAYAVAHLIARMEDGSLDPAPIWSDVETFDARPWRGLVDCVASGDPCQPNSEAGKRLGSEDDRWLLDRVLQIVDILRPDCFFRENVTGNADGQLAVAVPILERLGYRVACGIFSAREVRGSHIRERLFIMAQRAGVSRLVHQGQGRRGEAAADSGRIGRRTTLADSGDRQLQIPGRRSEGRDGPGSAGADLADTAHHNGRGGERGEKAGAGSEGRGWWGSAGGSIPLFAPGPDDCRWREILDRAPMLEPAVRRMADGMADRVDRLRLCGNGVFPLAAGYAWRALEARLAAASPGVSSVRVA